MRLQGVGGGAGGPVGRVGRVPRGRALPHPPAARAAAPRLQDLLQVLTVHILNYIYILGLP